MQCGQVDDQKYTIPTLPFKSYFLDLQVGG
jgi:hypothetical protein